MGVSTLGYPSGPAGPSEIGARSVEQVLPYSLATGIAESAQLEASSLAAATDTDRQQLASRQPPAAATVAAAETAAAEGPTRAPSSEKCYDCHDTSMPRAPAVNCSLLVTGTPREQCMGLPAVHACIA